jgi:hypothetical protein
MLNAVAELAQPERVASGSAADVGHHGGRGRKRPQQDLFRPLELQNELRVVEAGLSLPSA